MRFASVVSARGGASDFSDTMPVGTSPISGRHVAHLQPRCMRRLRDDAPRHQRPAQADRHAAEDAFERAELHRVGLRVAQRALQGDGARAVGAALAEQDQRRQHRIGARGEDLHQFLDHQFFEP